MKITRRFTKPGTDPFASVTYEKRTSRITNPDGSVVFEMNDAEIPSSWSQLATDIMVSKYFRKAGVPQKDASGQPMRDARGQIVTGPERSAREVIHRLAGCWRYWGDKYGYFDSEADGQAFYDELVYMLLHQMCAPNSPQWFNTGLNFAYGITGPAQGHWYCDPKTGELSKSRDAYSHPQPHACQPFHAPISTPQGPVPIGKIVTQSLTGLEVLDGTDGGNGTTHVVAVKANGVKDVFRVVLEDGSAVEATADHLIYAMASDGLSGRWVRLGSLERGSMLVKASRDRQPAPSPSTAASANAVASAQETHDVAAADVTNVRTLRQVAVKRIDRVSAQEVFDIQTESGQYLSNNILIHNCFIQSVSDDLVNPGGIMDLWTREARLFKYGSGTGSNFSKIRGENEPLSGGGKSSGLMSFLKIGDRAAGAIKSGGTTRRAAKMVCLDLDHPDVELFINWKVREEIKVAALAEGIKHVPRDLQETAKRLGLKLDYDFNGEAYMTVSGQNSNNSVRIPNRFFKAVQEGGDWALSSRTTGKLTKAIKATALWEQIAYAAWRCADPGVQYDDTINQWHTCPRSGRINASNPCVTGDTRVLTPDGVWRRIDQMIHIPGHVVTAKDDAQAHFTEGAFPTGTRDVYELRTAGGYRLTLTGDHKVWTKDRGWVAAENLRESDQIKLPNEPACPGEIGEPADAKFFQLLGLYVSGANGNLGALNLEQCLADPRLKDAFGRYVTGAWNERVYADDYVNPAMLSDDSATDRNDAGGTMTASFTNRRLLSRMRAFIRSEQGRPRLADEAFTAGLAAQKHLLAALFTADGTVDAGSLALQSGSAGLLEDVQLLLLGFGIQSAVYPVDCDGYDTTQDGGGASVCGELPDRQGRGSAASPPSRGDAAIRRHGLRIDSGSLRSFIQHVGLLPGTPIADAADRLVDSLALPFHAAGNFDRVASLTPAGRQQVFDLTEPVTSSFIANGLVVHNCSEYMFLDDTACNLASLNVLTFFDAEARRFDVEGYKHGIRLWTIVLEISVLMASFPSEAIAELSYTFRTLGLGYANLGAMLMQAGIAYDSPKGRAICGALTAILTGESYATSAELAAELGAFAGFEQNRSEMLRVMRNHRRAAYDVAHNAAAATSLGQFESLDIEPVGIDESQFADNDPMTPRAMLFAARDCWDRALSMGEKHGYRNAQTTVIAPTGTIGLLMDCDTTGVEPDFSLVKFKKLAGGGYFKIANQSLSPALSCLGYEPHQIHDILQFVMGTLTLHGAPHLGYEKLQSLGFTKEELEKIEAALPGVFEISFAFSPWSLGKAVFDRLEIPESEWQSPKFNLLRRLGFSRRQIDEANDWVCGRGTVEGAPHLKDEHLSVFDCANKCGKTGERYIAVEGHIRMMAAAQPFISGAISKTINLPNEATVEDIKNSYFLSWQLGLKANALYRDGSKLSQPLNSKSDEELDSSDDEEDAEAIEAAREEVAHDVARAAAKISESPAAAEPVSASAIARSDNLAPTHHTIERIVERIVERPLRRRLPDTRRAITHKFDVAGHEGYITVGLYEDGQPGEVFIRIAKEGSTIGGLMDTIATLVSVSLQYGVPVESLVRKFEHVRFEPSGMTRNPEIPIAKSLTDYIFRWMAMEFVPGYRSAHAPKRTPKPAAASAAPPSQPVAEAQALSDAGETLSLAPGFDEPPAALPPVPKKKEGNGHGPRFDVDSAKPIVPPFASDDELRAAHSAHLQAPEVGSPTPSAAQLRLAIVSDPLSQQGSELQADAPACDVCGSITVRSGTCYKCLNCGNSMGCS
jgi:ribonucleoside-diphosphate reductase alpha chain